MKVTEGEGKCGVGWNLSAGGGLYREVRGLPDEINTSYRKGWLHRTGNVGAFSPQADDILSTWADELQDYNALEALHSNYSLDTEPDIFTASAPGLSVQFVLDQSGGVHFLRYADVTIQFSPSVQTPHSITITTNQGVSYVFGGTSEQPQYRDMSLRRSEVKKQGKMNAQAKYIPKEVMLTSVNYCYNWKLNKITSTASGTEATFHYKYNSSQLADGASRTYFTIDSANYLMDLYKFHELSHIKLKSYKANFYWSHNLLASVVIKDTVSLDEQKLQFKYINVTSSGSVTKQFLSQVNRIGVGCERGESHSFEYGGIVPPSIGNYSQLPALNWRKNFQQDVFGYYNGVVGNYNKPTLYFAIGEADARRLRVHPITGGSYTTINGNDRTPSTSFGIGALTKITFPSGGRAFIGYEANKYLDTSVSPNATYTGPGARVNKITLQGGEAAFGKTIADTSASRAVEKVYHYVLSGSSTTSGKITAPVKLGYITDDSVEQVVNNLGDEPVVMYSRVTEKIAGKGYTVYEFNLPGMFPETANGLWKATKSKIARNVDVPANYIKNGYYLFPYAPSTNYDFKRGQLTRTATYSETNTLLYEKTLTYAPVYFSPLVIRGVRFEKLNAYRTTPPQGVVGGIYYYGYYEILTGQDEFLQQEVVKQASLEDPTKLLQTTTTYAYNANKMLSSVTTVLPNSTTTVKSIQYAKDFQFTSPANSEAIAIKALNQKNMGGSVIEEYTAVTVPGPITTKTSAQVIIYKDQGNGVALPYQIKTLLPGAAHTPATMSGQSFSYPSASFRTSSQIDEYEEGKARTAVDDKMNTISTHFATSNGIPVASFVNSTAKQSAFDNFENGCSFGFTPSAPELIVSGGRTGERSALFTNNTQTLTRSGIERKDDSVRVSCWAKASTERSVTFIIRNGTTVVSQKTVAVPSPISANEPWGYIEIVLKLNGNPGPFNLEVKSDATTTSTVGIDDLVLVPFYARVSHQTALPFKGITSSSDDRGISTKITYDYLGRPVNTLDRNRNLINRKEYSIKNSVAPSVYARFTVLPSQPSSNDTVRFTPTVVGMTNCDPNLTYTWLVDDVIQPAGAGGVLEYIFQTAGVHNVKFTAISSLYGSYSMTKTVCVNQASSVAIQTSVTNSSGQPAGLSLDCNSGVRNLNLILPPAVGGCFYNVVWTKNGYPVGSGMTLTITPITIPLQGTAITETYVANVTLDCSGFTDCIPTIVDAFTGDTNFVVTHSPADCQ